MKKNKLLVGLLAVASLAGLVGCNNAGTDSGTGGDSSIVVKSNKEKAIESAWKQIDVALGDEVKTNISSRNVNLPAVVNVTEGDEEFHFTVDYIFTEKYQPEETKNFKGYVAPVYQADDSEELQEPKRTVKFDAPVKETEDAPDYLTYKGKAVLKEDGKKISDKIYEFNVALVKYVKLNELSSQLITKGTPVVTYAYYTGLCKYGFAADGKTGISLFKPELLGDGILNNASFEKPVLVKITGSKDMYSGLLQIKGACVEPVTEASVAEEQLPAIPEKLVVTNENIDKLDYVDEGRYTTITGTVQNMQVGKYIDFEVALDPIEVDGETVTKALFIHFEKGRFNVDEETASKLEALKDGQKVDLNGWLSCYKSNFQMFPTSCTLK